MSLTHCSQCRTPFGPRSYPRIIRDDRDARTCPRPVETIDLGGKPVRITWVERMTCDCGWRCLVRLVDVRVLELLLPDPTARHEIQRRAT